MRKLLWLGPAFFAAVVLWNSGRFLYMAHGWWGVAGGYLFAVALACSAWATVMLMEGDRKP